MKSVKILSVNNIKVITSMESAFMSIFVDDIDYISRDADSHFRVPTPREMQLLHNYIKNKFYKDYRELMEVLENRYEGLYEEC